MPKNREQSVSQDISTPEKRSSESGLEIAKTPALKNVVSRANELAEAIQQDRPVTAEQVLDLEKELGNLKVMVGGEEMTVEEARQIPDLKMNMEIWEEIESGNLNRVEELTYITTHIAKSLREKLNRVGKNALELWNIRSIEEKTLISLSQYEHSLFLDGLKNITDRQAEILSKHQGTSTNDVLTIGVKTLPTKQAMYLSKHNGDLLLEELVSMSDEAADFFVDFEYRLITTTKVKQQVERLRRKRIK